eukprot:15365168-Ditylum_brightwellii.AAC.3
MPPPRLMHGVTVNRVVYSFVDVSSSGFGSKFWKKDTSGKRFCVGAWGGMRDKTSILCELKNAVDFLEVEGEKGRLAGAEILLFGDSQVGKAIFYKGTMMIAQGTNRISCGNLSEGLMRGKDIMGFVSLHLMVTQVSPTLEEWIRSWIHLGVFVWELAPVTASAAIKDLRKAMANLMCPSPFGTGEEFALSVGRGLWLWKAYFVPTLEFPEVTLDLDKRHGAQHATRWVKI